MQLNKAGQQLKILPHHVLNDKGETIELCSSVECKGIIGNDGRHYILDLLRTFPPDVNFLKCEQLFTVIISTLRLFIGVIFLVDEELSKEVKALGFPIEHKHKLCCLRQELIDSFVDSRYMMFIKYAAFHLQHLNLRKNEEMLNSVKDKVIKEENEKNAADGKEIEEKQNEDKEDKESDDNKHLETEVAKKMVESITDGNKLECKCIRFRTIFWTFFYGGLVGMEFNLKLFYFHFSKPKKIK